MFNPHEEQLLRRMVELLRHAGATRRSLLVSEALQRVAAEEGAPSLPARDAETVQVSRRISPAAVDRDPDDSDR